MEDRFFGYMCEDLHQMAYQLADLGGNEHLFKSEEATDKSWEDLFLKHHNKQL